MLFHFQSYLLVCGAVKVKVMLHCGACHFRQTSRNSSVKIFFFSRLDTTNSSFRSFHISFGILHLIFYLNTGFWLPFTQSTLFSIQCLKWMSHFQAVCPSQKNSCTSVMYFLVVGKVKVFVPDLWLIIYIFIYIYIDNFSVGLFQIF